MPTTSARLGLAKPLTSDAFSTTVLAANWQKLDDSPGLFIAQTAANLPAGWASAHAGMHVYQVDASILWRWNGSAFVRAGAVGHLGNNRRTANMAGTASWQVVASVSVTVPVGGRNIGLGVTWSEVSGGAGRMRLMRGATQLVDWKVTTDGGGASYVDLAPAAGSTTFTYEFRNNSALATPVSTLLATGAQPASLDVREL